MGLKLTFSCYFQAIHTTSPVINYWYFLKPFNIYSIEVWHHKKFKSRSATVLTNRNTYWYPFWRRICCCSKMTQLHTIFHLSHWIRLQHCEVLWHKVIQRPKLKLWENLLHEVPIHPFCRSSIICPCWILFVEWDQKIKFKLRGKHMNTFMCNSFHVIKREWKNSK